MASLTIEVFEDYIRYSLTHLYDYAALQEHPLPRLLVPDAEGNASRIQAFRQLIIESITALKTGQSGPSSKQARLFDILALRYVEQQGLQQTLLKLNLSERQFYRDHGQAMATLTRYLWDACVLQDAAPPADISVQSELQRLNSQQTQEEALSIELKTFLPRISEAIRSLCDKQDVRVVFTRGDHDLVINVDPVLLRQALIWLLSQMIIQSPPGTRLTVSVSVDERCYRFVVRAPYGADERGYRALLQQETLRTLVRALGGQLHDWAANEDENALALEIPCRQYRLLLIDDNPDVVQLFQRYLADQPYHLCIAQQGEQAIRIAQELRPDLIILDVLLPKLDGWEVLRILRSLPATRDIPVLVCSVLNANELAVSLGADGFLRKPPGEEEFFRAIRSFALKSPSL